MSINPKDLWKLLDDTDHHARSILAKNTELRAMLAQINFPKEENPFKCAAPTCGWTFKTEGRLRQHEFNVHGIGEPAPLDPHEEAAV